MPTASALRFAGFATVLTAAILWGTAGTVQALLPAASEPLVVAAARLIVGAATLLAIAAADRASRRGFRLLPARWIVGAGLAIGGYNALFFLAIPGAGVGIGTALAIGSAPIWATFFERLFWKRGPDRRQLLGQALAITGAVLLVTAGAAAAASLAGMALALAAGAAYAGYSLMTSHIGRAAPSTSIAAATFAVAAIALAPVLALLPTAWVVAPAAWPKLAFLGVVATGLAYTFYTWGLRHVAPATAVTLALAEPLTAWLLAVAVVGEPLTPLKLVGAIILLAGLAIVTAAAAPRREASGPRDRALRES